MIHPVTIPPAEIRVPSVQRSSRNDRNGVRNVPNNPGRMPWIITAFHRSTRKIEQTIVLVGTP